MGKKLGSILNLVNQYGRTESLKKQGRIFPGQPA
jgi:hypothetical protein